ncbi:AAA family ATPase [Streptomyces sp. 796.1]|uniref:helix-turn-helix transcriptional regulator n=1 Tax=Streptomyces sp. 796.1 TaxID=3163029 RepID=UPI0039C9B463
MRAANHVTGRIGAVDTGAPPRSTPQLIGRDTVVQQLIDCATALTGPAVWLVRGEIGIGRSAVLAALAERVRATGVTVHEVACLPRDHHTAYLLAHRLVTALSPTAALRAVTAEPSAPGTSSPAAARRPDGQPRTDQSHPTDPSQPSHAGQPGPAHHPSHPAHASQPGPDDPGRLLTRQLTRALRTRTRTVVLVDDAQFADPETVDLVRVLAPLLALSAVRLVLGVSPVRPPGSAPRAPRGPSWPFPDDLAGDPVWLPPLTRQEVARLVTHRLRAVPDRDLVAELYRLSAGNPGALAAVLGPAGEPTIGTLIGHAQLRPGAAPPVLPDDDRFVRALAGLGEATWRVAKALSVLEPLGSRTPAILATTTGLSAAAVAGALAELTAAGLVDEAAEPGPAARADTPARRWSFRVPLVAAALRARLGPYERRAVSAAAVRALWEESDRAAPGEGGGQRRDAERRAYLANRIVDAGALVDRSRALSELLFISAQLAPVRPRDAARWLRAAADLTDDPLLRASSLARHAATAYRAGDAREAADAAGAVLRTHGADLSPAARQELTVVRLMALAAAGDMAALGGQHGPASRATEGPSAIAGALTLCLLGHWAQALDLIAATGLGTRPDPVTRHFGALLRDAARLMVGTPAGLYAAVDAPADPSLPPHLAFELTLLQCDGLLALGSVRQAVALLERRGHDTARLPAETRFLWQFLTGSWDEALATARTVMVSRRATARPPVSVLVHAHTSTMLLAHGRPSRARTVLDQARAQPIAAAYLLDAQEAAIALFLGEPALAEEAVRRGLGEARERGHVFGTESLWTALAALQGDGDRPERVLLCLREVDRVATAMASDRSRLRYLRACLGALDRHPELASDLPDGSALADEALTLARTDEQPFELARTLLAVASSGGRARPETESLLREAYEVFGQLGALVWRYRTRTALRDAGLPVPGRRTVTEENERLLATLVTEGLANRQIARALAVSEGSVASRLNRLFHRTGLRSRVELATLMLTTNER